MKNKLLIALYIFCCFSFMALIIAFGQAVDFYIIEYLIASTLISFCLIVAVICKRVIEWLISEVE